MNWILHYTPCKRIQYLCANQECSVQHVISKLGLYETCGYTAQNSYAVYDGLILVLL